MLPKVQTLEMELSYYNRKLLIVSINGGRERGKATIKSICDTPDGTGYNLDNF